MSARDPWAGVAAPRSGHVKLVAESGAALTLIRSGDVDASGRVGGWETSERVLRPDASWWKATPLATLSIPCILDIDETGGPSIERRLQVLYQMGRPSEDEDPPAIRLFGVLPTPATVRWKLDDVKLGAILERPDQPGELRRVELTLELSELYVATGVDEVTVRRTRGAGGASSRRRRTITARAGDTVRAIAVRQLGSSGAYKQIREWNPKLKRVDPDAPLRAGTKVVLH